MIDCCHFEDLILRPNSRQRCAAASQIDLTARSSIYADVSCANLDVCVPTHQIPLLDRGVLWDTIIPQKPDVFRSISQCCGRNGSFEDRKPTLDRTVRGTGYVLRGGVTEIGDTTTTTSTLSFRRHSGGVSILIFIGGTVYTFQSYNTCGDIEHKLQKQRKELWIRSVQNSIFDPRELKVVRSSVIQRHIHKKLSIIQARIDTSSSLLICINMGFRFLMTPIPIGGWIIPGAPRSRFRAYHLYMCRSSDRRIRDPIRIIGLLQVRSGVLRSRENYCRRLRTILSVPHR